MLTREGANAFLKTLEEPPPHAVFILATTAPEALPPTILSRCQRYAFRRIPIAVMIARMREIAEAENISIGDDALGAIAYRADGGLRDALTMLEQVASYAQGPIDATTVEAAFGATGRQYARGLVEAVLAGDAATALRIVDEASDAGADMTGLIRGAVAEYRNLLVARIDPQLLARDLSASDAGTVVALAGSVAQPKVVRGLRLLGDALAAGRGSGNPRLELETAVLRLVVQAEDPSLEALATRVALLETGTSATASAAPAARGIPASANAAAAPVRERAVAVTPSPPAADATVPAPSVQQVRSLWDQIRLRAEERYKPMRGMLAQATVDSLEGNALVIGVVDALQESLMRERLPILERAVGDVLGLPLRIVFRTRGGAAPRTPRAASSERAPNPARTATVERTTSDASEITNNGEADLLAYARQKLGGTERR